VDHIGSDLRTELRKLKQAYETLSSNKDQEVSKLVAEKDSVSNQLSTMHQDYANKKVEAALATEAALKLQQSVDELKVLAQKKDDEIARLQAQAVGAKMNLQKTHSLVKEKDDETPRLKIRQPMSVLRPIKDSNETHKKSRSDDPAVSVKSRNNVGKDGQYETSQKRRRVSSTSDVNILFLVTWSCSH
jgi:chromosome segregation ATPase